MHRLLPGLLLLAACAHPTAQNVPGPTVMTTGTFMTTGASTANSSQSSSSVRVVAGSAVLLASIDGLGQAVYARRLGATPGLALEQARSWLEGNRLQLAEDLALGTGPTLDDLATVAAIAPAHRVAFTRALQQHRAELMPGLVPTVADTSRLLGAIGALVLADPVLSADGEAFVARRMTH